MDITTILLVEDNPDDEALTMRVLEKNHICNRVFVAHDGAEALNFLFCTNLDGDHQNELPSLVLLEMCLPTINGLEVLRRIRANDRTRRLPVVMLASSSEEQDVINSYNGGANSYLCKPVKFAEYVDVLRQLCLYWLVLNQTAVK